MYITLFPIIFPKSNYDIKIMDSLSLPLDILQGQRILIITYSQFQKIPLKYRVIRSPNLRPYLINIPLISV